MTGVQTCALPISLGSIGFAFNMGADILLDKIKNEKIGCRWELRKAR